MNLLEMKEELESKGIPIFSISRLDCFNNCKANFKDKYVDKVEKELLADNIYSHIGGAIHDAQETIYNLKTLTDKECRNVLNSKFKECQKIISDRNSNIILENLDKRDMLKFGTEQIEENYMVSVNHYIDNFIKEPQERVNELYVLFEIEGVYFQGYIDAIEACDKENKTLRIIDYKTSTKFSGADVKDKSRQLLLYADAIQRIYGIKVEQICWDMIKYLNAKYKHKLPKGGKRSTLFLRKGWVSQFQKEMKDALDRKEVPMEEQIDIIIDAMKTNTLPDIIKDDFEIWKGYVYYDVNEENIEEARQYVIDTVNNINKEQKYKPLNIKESDFFCNTLCDSRKICQHLKKHKEKVEQLQHMDMSNLFG